MSKNPKYIFVCGGVLSGVGKGIATASIGYLLKEQGYKVTAVKIDPYLNIDAGLMRPAEHGEVYVTEDGGEIDQDLGNYERFLHHTFSKRNNITSGKVYERIINKERQMSYGGRDVEIFPDMINEIKAMIRENVVDEDFVLVEIGGTTGDVENLPFLHAAREMGKENKCIYIMVTYLPFLRSVGELKTKPTQHAVANLRQVGIIPDFIITRNEIPIDEPRKESISKRCFVELDNIIDNPDLESIYEIPVRFHNEEFDKKILAKFGLKLKKSSIEGLDKFVKTLKGSKKSVKIGLIGKYVTHGSTAHLDTYISVLEAIKHAAGQLGVHPEIKMIASDIFEKDPKQLKMLDELDCVIVPQGWGSRGSEGKIKAIEYVRKNKIPYLGLCYGMQMAAIEFARNVLKLKDANSEEIDSKTSNPVIHIMPNQKEYLAKKQYGGTIRLGGWDCVVTPGSIVHSSYKKHEAFKNEKKDLISERHRHRYEFNNEYRDAFVENGMKISGTSVDGELVEFIELDKKIHPFFVGTQAHPEYKSYLLKAHPLFLELIKAGLKS
jgi:CTP synthase